MTLSRFGQILSSRPWRFTMLAIVVALIFSDARLLTLSLLIFFLIIAAIGAFKKNSLLLTVIMVLCAGGLTSGGDFARRELPAVDGLKAGNGRADSGAGGGHPAFPRAVAWRRARRDALDRVLDPEIELGEDVRASQPEHEEHLRGPAADALHLRERLDHVLVGQSTDLVEPHDAVVRQANASLEDHQKIRRAVVWPGPELPRTEGTRKLKRAAIRDWVRSGATVSPLAQQGSDALSALLGKYAGSARLSSVTTAG